MFLGYVKVGSKFLFIELEERFFLESNLILKIRKLSSEILNDMFKVIKLEVIFLIFNFGFILLNNFVFFLKFVIVILK